MMGYGQLYHLPTDPHELNNRFGQPDVAREQAALMAELTMWTIRTQDSLPTGPQDRKYQTKWARPHNWYAPYRRTPAGSAFIPYAEGEKQHGTTRESRALGVEADRTEERCVGKERFSTVRSWWAAHHSKNNTN